jgi:tryptophan-rich sensory protein
VSETLVEIKKTDRSGASNMFALAGWFLLSFAASGVGAVASVNARDFYQDLVRPTWAPPGWLFGPVWTTLFALMAIAAWLVWRARGWQGARTPLTVFVFQLVFNALWSWLFFAWRMGTAAIVDVLLLWVLIVVTLVLFWRVRPLAGALLLPYLLWVTYASALTIWIVRHNVNLL